MRTFTADQFEFDDASTEERVEIVISARAPFPHPTVASFLKATIVGYAVALPNCELFSSTWCFAIDSGYLSRFAGIDTSDDVAWDCYTLSDQEGERHHILESADCFISYRWSTAA